MICFSTSPKWFVLPAFFSATHRHARINSESVHTVSLENGRMFASFGALLGQYAGSGGRPAFWNEVKKTLTIQLVPGDTRVAQESLYEAAAARVGCAA